MPAIPFFTVKLVDRHDRDWSAASQWDAEFQMPFPRGFAIHRKILDFEFFDAKFQQHVRQRIPQGPALNCQVRGTDDPSGPMVNVLFFDNDSGTRSHGMRSREKLQR